MARLTALHVPAWVSSAQALTRFVGLRPLLSGHTWPGLEELVRRFVAYGASHGAWQPGTGFAEGSLARVFEAALGQPPALPTVSANPDFLCGTELSTIEDETLFFAQRGLSIDAVAVEVRLQPGELLLFDNRQSCGRPWSTGKPRQANCTKECSGTGTRPWRADQTPGPPACRLHRLRHAPGTPPSRGRVPPWLR